MIVHMCICMYACMYDITTKVKKCIRIIIIIIIIHIFRMCISIHFVHIYITTLGLCGYLGNICIILLNNVNMNAIKHCIIYAYILK